MFNHEDFINFRREFLENLECRHFRRDSCDSKKIATQADATSIGPLKSTRFSIRRLTFRTTSVALATVRINYYFVTIALSYDLRSDNLYLNVYFIFHFVLLLSHHF